MTYQEAQKKFEKYLSLLERSENTIDTYNCRLNQWNKFLRNKGYSLKDIQKIPLKALEDYLYELRIEGKSSATRALVLNTIRSFYSYLTKHDITKENLAAKMDSIKVSSIEATFLSEKEIKLLLSAPETVLLKTVVATLYYTGLRIGELISLSFGDVDLDRKIISVRCGKGKKHRIVPVNKKLESVLKTYLKNHRNFVSSKNFFATLRSGSITPQYVNKKIDEAAKKVKIEKHVTCHTLRHSFASHLVRKKVSLPAVQKLLGHSDLRITSRYLHSDYSELKDAVDKM